MKDKHHHSKPNEEKMWNDIKSDNWTQKYKLVLTYKYVQL